MFFHLSTPNCHHTRLPNGIYEFIFLDNSRQSVDDYLMLLDHYMTAVDRGEFNPPMIRMVVEFKQVGMPPIAYMAGHYLDLAIQHPSVMPPTRVAYVYAGGFMMSIVRGFLTLVPNRSTLQRAFFPAAERVQAEAWLLEEKTPLELEISDM